MKKFVLSCLLAVSAIMSAVAEDYLTILGQAEKWINKTYQAGSLAHRRAIANLTEIDAQKSSEADKIAKIKKAFPKAFSATNYISKLKKQAEAGDIEAQFNLGMCYANGYGVEKNLTEAANWYRKAAEQGYAAAQYNLGLYYHNGYGVEKNLPEAVKWYRKAAEQGDAEAQYILGLCYYCGDGVEKNLAEAVKWFRKAAEQGYADAQKALKRLNMQ